MSIVENKKAFHDYEILEKLEAGIVLTGPEVKSCRDKAVNLKGSYVNIHNNFVYAEGIHISPYRQADKENAGAKYNPTHRRRLLLHLKQIEALATKLNEQGVTIVPLELYLKGSLIKLVIGLCRGRKLYDKREMLKSRAQNLDVARALKRK